MAKKPRNPLCAAGGSAWMALVARPFQGRVVAGLKAPRYTSSAGL